jgi:DNA-binding PadR family transcriptional regulator
VVFVFCRASDFNILTSLLDNGLVEEVQNPRWPSTKPCYRLTELGHAVIKRGRYARPRPKRPKLKMLEPRIKPMEPRIKPLKRR